MLSPADAAFVRRDPGLPGLALLLDQEAFVAELRAALPDAGIGAATAEYVRYKPGTNCLVAYRLALPGGSARIHARAYAPAIGNKLRHARALRGAAGVLGVGGITLDESAVAVFAWPHDHELPALAQLADADLRQDLLAQICSTRNDLTGEPSVLAYRPERRYVGRLAGRAAGDAVLKLYCPRDYGRARAGAAAFRSVGPLRVAKVLGASPEHRALLFGWQQGRPLASALEVERWDARPLRLVGAALAALHGQAAALPAREAPALIDELEAAARAVATVCPSLAAEARDVTGAIVAELCRSPVVQRPLHGDFYADQVVLDGDHVTLLDLDNACWGDPAADLGTFAAHLRRDALMGRVSPRSTAAALDALREGYAERAAPPPQQQVALYEAIGLLRLAPEPFRYRAPNWPAQMGVLLECARAVLVERGADATPTA